MTASADSCSEPNEVFDQLVLLDGAQAVLIAAMLDVYALLLPTPAPAMNAMGDLGPLLDVELISELSSAIRAQLEPPQ